MAEIDGLYPDDENEPYPPVRTMALRGAMTSPPTWDGSAVPVRPPVGAAPDIRDTGAPPDMPPVRPAGGPSFDEAVRGSVGMDRPTLPEYAPPVQHGWKRAADTILPFLGNLALPGFGTAVATMVPGTREAYNRDFSTRLGNYDRAEKAYESRLKDTLAQSREENEEPLVRAQTQEAEANAEARRNPLPKEGLTPQEQTLHDLMAGNNGQPRINPDTGRPYTYLEAYTATMQAAQDVKPEKQPTDREQDVSDYLASRGMRDTPANREKARTAIAERAKEGGWSLQNVSAPDGTTHTVWVNSRSRETRPFEGGVKTGTSGKDKSTQLNSLSQQTQGKLAALDKQHAAGQVDDGTYVDQSLSIWKNYAQSARRFGQVPAATQPLVELYKRKYGTGQAVIDAMKADGWEVGR